MFFELTETGISGEACVSEYLGKYDIYPKYCNTLSTKHICPKIWNSF